MGVFWHRRFIACVNGFAGRLGAVSIYFLVLILGCVAGSAGFASDDDGSWRLIEFSVELRMAVFANSTGNLERFATSERLDGGQWVIDSIAADHVVLQPAGPSGRALTRAGVILRRGETLPDPDTLEQETSYYCQVHGVVIDDIDLDADELHIKENQ